MTPQKKIREEAANWLLRREEARWTLEDEEAFGVWMRLSDAHKAAYWRLEQGWRAADRVSALDLYPGERRSLRSGGFLLPLVAAASVALAISGVFVWNYVLRPVAVAQQRLETSVGEHETRRLPDGSQVELNTGTRVRTAFASSSREIWLDRGEAYFEVAHDPSRPFIIHASDKNVVAVGTKFSVRRERDYVLVLVSQGTVRIEDADGAKAANARATLITAGDIGRFQHANALIEQRAPERVSSALAWRRGMLVFDQRTLGQIADDFNRYNRRQLVVEGRASITRIGGAFDTRDVEGFAKLLHDAYGLNVSLSPDVIKISQ